MATIKRNDDNTITVVFSNGYTVKFKQPTETILGMCMAAGRRDPNGGADVLIENGLIEGNKSKLKDTVSYLRQIALVSSDIFGEVDASLTWNGDIATVEFTDGRMVMLKPAGRDIYSQAQLKSKQNPLNYTKHLLTACWVEGDESVKKSPGHLLGFAACIESFLDYTGEELGKP